MPRGGAAAGQDDTDTLQTTPGPYLCQRGRLPVTTHDDELADTPKGALSDPHPSKSLHPHYFPPSSKLTPHSQENKDFFLVFFFFPRNKRIEQLMCEQ